MMNAWVGGLTGTLAGPRLTSFSTKTSIRSSVSASIRTTGLPGSSEAPKLESGGTLDAVRSTPCGNATIIIEPGLKPSSVLWGVGSMCTLMLLIGIPRRRKAMRLPVAVEPSFVSNTEDGYGSRQWPPDTLRSSQPESEPQSAVSVLAVQRTFAVTTTVHGAPQVRAQAAPAPNAARRLPARDVPGSGVPLRRTLTRCMPAPASLITT